MGYEQVLNGSILLTPRLSPLPPFLQSAFQFLDRVIKSPNHLCIQMSRVRIRAEEDTTSIREQGISELDRKLLQVERIRVKVGEHLLLEPDRVHIRELFLRGLSP